MRKLDYPDFSTLIKGKIYIAKENFNGGIPTHNFLKMHEYQYTGISYDRYDGDFLLGFLELYSNEQYLLIWNENNAIFHADDFFIESGLNSLSHYCNPPSFSHTVN